ncbi:replication protein A 32 kDa subunit A-like [Phalaenopsis equestris]|uniref:replication protein A 32 kDa subunit A-like n=1 Tax=Phalaenopsis equestris TaxID=78828 RepID=UPI0009E5AA3F|nr:replication protein A 32 kDa subunit A-like [Phalaenopsis equestris]
MSFTQFDGNASLFAGGGLTSSQVTQPADSSLSKGRTANGVIPLTVKQISDAYHSSDDMSSFAVDGVVATHLKLLGLVMNKTEKTTDVTFTIDDGTGRISVIRWVNDTADANEVALIQNGIYVTVIGTLKDFQGKMQVSAFSIRAVVDYNEILLHFIHCIQVHAYHSGEKVVAPAQLRGDSVKATNASSGVKENHSPASNQSSVTTSNTVAEADIYKLVLGIFEEPESLAIEHGMHVDEVVRRLGIPHKRIMEAINYHVDLGHIYSTIDDYHFKSACTG